MIPPRFAKRFSSAAHKSSAVHKSFRFKDLKVKPKTCVKPDFSNASFGFGHIATDYMVTIDYNDAGGWDAPVISPFEPIPFHPFNSTLHYALCAYEGMKAYRGADNTIRLFRPMDNMKRFVQSNLRLAFPSFDPHELLKVVEEYTKMEQSWIPHTTDATLYLRPFSFSTANVLGVHRATSTRIMVVASPVDRYFAGSIHLSVYEDYWRGSPKSAAAYKIGANYAPTVLIGDDLAKKGYSQAVWVYDDKFLESGATNLFFLVEADGKQLEIVTPRLDGSILPGITRDSIIKLAPNILPEVKVVERDFTIQEFKALHAAGRMKEVFVCGTASVVSEVMSLEIRGKVFEMAYPENREALVCQQIRRYLTDIQFGRIEHPFSHIII